MVGAALFHLPCGCMALDWGASDMGSMAGQSLPGSDVRDGLTAFSLYLAHFTLHAATHRTSLLHVRRLWWGLPCFICLVGVWHWIGGLLTWAPWLDSHFQILMC